MQNKKRQLSHFQSELNKMIRDEGKAINDSGGYTWLDLDTFMKGVKKLIRRYAPDLFSKDFGFKLGKFNLTEREYQKVKDATNILGKIIKRSK